jgi:tetraacyldisaccharide 4'-kinase
MRDTLRARLLRVLSQAWLRRGYLACLLWPVSLVMLMAVRFRQGLYLSGLLQRHRLAVPVIVIGNVVVGGTGKTPVVMAVVRHLQAQGWHPGVISRGYGRSSQECREVQVKDPASLVGDEPALIKRSTQVPVFVASRRVEAARSLLASYPDTDVLVSDDGLQHYALGRDIEICLFDDRGLGNGFLLPAGLLREPWPRQVDLVLHTGSLPALTGYTSQRKLADYAVRSDGSRLPLAALVKSDQRPVLAIAAIAQPEAFFNMLRAQGLVLSMTQALPDHHDFQDWHRPDAHSHVLLCTEKDAVKLWALHPDAWAVPLEFRVEPAFFSALDRLLEADALSPVSSGHGHKTS